MKKNVRIVVSICLATIALFSCTKYEEGPGMSFRSKKKRLANSWRIESVTVNGIEQAADPFFAKQKHYIYESGSYIVTIVDPITLVAENVQGNWTLYDDDKKLAVNRTNYNGVADSTEDYQILQLRENALWLRSLDNQTEYHFTPFDESGN